MKSRDVIAESFELNDLKELRLVYPCLQAGTILVGRTIGRPAQWKADLHAFALSFLPAVVAFMVTLAWNDAMGTTLRICIVLYAIMVITVALFKYHSTKDDNKVLDRIFRRIIGLVVVAFLLAAVGILSGDPVIQGWVALVAAAVTAIFSQKFLALDPKYLVGAKKSPPLFSDREKRVWKIAAAVYGVLVVAALPRLLPENIPMTIIVGSGLAVLLYYLFKYL